MAALQNPERIAINADKMHFASPFPVCAWQVIAFSVLFFIFFLPKLLFFDEAVKNS
jgi:hypothetical protein